MEARDPGDGATAFMQLGSLCLTLPCHPETYRRKKQNIFLLDKVLSVQTVRAVCFLEMAQRDGGCRGGGCSSRAALCLAAPSPGVCWVVAPSVYGQLP